MISKFRWALSMALLGAVACSQYVDEVDSEPTKTGEDPIIRGIEYSDADAARTGVVLIGPSGCSASLLDQRWVISAAHCIGSWGDTNNDGEIDDPQANGFEVRFGNMDDPNRLVIPVDRVVKHPRATFGSASGIDIVLLHMTQDAPFPSLPGNAFINGRMAMYGGANSSLEGTTITLMGYGSNEGGYPSGIGYGTLREGYNPVLWADEIITVRNLNGDHLTCNGDSGGPAYLDVRGANGLLWRALVDVHSTSTCDSSPGFSSGAGAQTFIEWVEQTAWGITPAQRTRIACLNQSCQSSPNPLPNSTSATQMFTPWGVGQDQCYFYYVNYNMEKNWDYVYVGRDRYTGNGVTRGHWCGPLPLALTTDFSIQSQGMTISAQYHTVAYNGAGEPDPATCGPTAGNWNGCAAHGCSVCADKLKDYPRYFINHPNCAPALACSGQYSTCNSKCPAPTWRDM